MIVHFAGKCSQFTHFTSTDQGGLSPKLTIDVKDKEEKFIIYFTICISLTLSLAHIFNAKSLNSQNWSIFFASDPSVNIYTPTLLLKESVTKINIPFSVMDGIRNDY